MKNTITLIILVVVSSTFATGQTAFPVQSSYDYGFKKEDLKALDTATNELDIYKSLLSEAKAKSIREPNAENTAVEKFAQKQVDLATKKLDSLVLVASRNKGYSPEKDKRLFVHGLSSGSSIEDLRSSIEASQKFSLTWRVNHSNFERENPLMAGFDITFSANAVNLKPRAIPRDSLDLVSLMFPETGNVGFMLSPTLWFVGVQNKAKNMNHRIGFQASTALRQTTLSDFEPSDSATKTELNISILNHNLMLLYTFDYNPTEKVKSQFAIGFYANFFNVPNEDVQSFNRLFPNDEPLFLTEERSSIRSVGVKVSASVNGLSAFVDLRQNYTHLGLANDNPFKGFVYNFGFGQNIEFLKL